MTSVMCSPWKRTFTLVLLRSKHIIRSKKGHKMLDIINQNQTFIFLLSFKTIVIMVNYSFSPYMNVKELRIKIHSIQF